MVEPSPPEWGRPSGSATPGPADFPPAPPSNGSATPAEREYSSQPPSEAEDADGSRPWRAASPASPASPGEPAPTAYEGEIERSAWPPPPPTWGAPRYPGEHSNRRDNGAAGARQPRDSADPPYAAGMYASAYAHTETAPRSVALDAAPPRSALAMLWPWGLRGIAETIEVLALALLMFLLVRSVAQNFIVEGGSMEPTLHSGEMLIVNKLSYRSFDLAWLPGVDAEDWRPFGAPEAGDVVVFRFPQDPDRDFIKRVIALPGETVEISGGVLKVNGAVREEPFLGQPAEYRYGPEKVPPGHLFVLGDNRNNSYDSHSWGMLDQSLLIGRAELRYWPFGKFGRVDHGEPAEPQAGVAQSPSTPR